jgi:hypothetical protein
MVGSSSAVTISAPENILSLELCSLLNFEKFLFSKEMFFGSLREKNISISRNQISLLILKLQTTAAKQSKMPLLFLVNDLLSLSVHLSRRNFQEAIQCLDETDFSDQTMKKSRNAEG